MVCALGAPPAWPYEVRNGCAIPQTHWSLASPSLKESVTSQQPLLQTLQILGGYGALTEF